MTSWPSDNSEPAPPLPRVDCRKVASTCSTLREFFEQAYAPRRLTGKSENTKRLYENSLRNFEKFLGHAPTLDDLTDENVSFLMDWHLSRGNSAHTANKDAGQLMALWRFAARKGVLKEFPDVDLVPAPVRIPRAWNQADLDLIFDYLSRMKGYIGDVKASKWWIGLHSFLWYTGERIGAAMRLRWTDVDLDAGQVWVRAETRKGRRQDRLYRIGTPAIQALLAMREPDRELVFEWPYSASYLWTKYKSLRQAAGLPVDRKSSFHRIRKSHASHAKAAGLDPTALMGHADARTTAKYLDPTICGQQDVCDVLFKPGQNIDASQMRLF